MTYLTDDMRSRLTGMFAAAGATAIDLPTLYSADLFVDLIGEDIRRRLYVAPGANGQAMALRPEFTIPACLHHLSSGPAHRAACYGYVGPVFRQRSDDQPGEFYQAGIEQIDPTGDVTFDADSVARAAKAVTDLSGCAPRITLGDRALFSALLSALDAPAVWQRRLEGAFGDRKVLDRMIERMASGGSDNHGASAGLARVLDGKASDDVREAVEEMLAIAGLATVGGRSVGDIAERYMEKAELAANAGWDSAKIDVIKRYLAIAGPLDEAMAALEQFDAKEGGLLGEALATMKARAEAISSALPSDANIHFSADFGRRLDYYSGFNFELHCEGQAQPVAGGGRYDRLLALLAPKANSDAKSGTNDIAALPAIGFAIWLDRLAKA